MELLTREWLYNAGLVGFIQILREADIEFEIKHNSLVLNDDDFIAKENELTEVYIKTLLKKYKNILPWYRINAKIDGLMNADRSISSEKDKNKIEELNLVLKKIKDKFQSKSYESILKLNNLYDGTKETIKDMKTIKWNSKKVEEIQKEFKKQMELINGFRNWIEENNVDYYFYVAELTYNAIDAFWNDNAFKNVMVKHKKDVKKLIHEEFISPISKSLNVQPNDKSSVQCFSCNQMTLKKNTTGLSRLREVGVDKNKKSSHFWNHEPDDFICPVCALIYQCLPIGFNLVLSQGIFVNDNRSIHTLLQKNTILIEKEFKLSDIEQKSYTQFLNKIQEETVNQRNAENHNIQVIKFDENKKPTYQFNFITSQLLTYLDVSNYELITLKNVIVNLGTETKTNYVNIYQQVLERLYQRGNLYDILQNYLRIYLDDQGKIKESTLEKLLNIQSKIQGLKLNRGDFLKSVKSFRYAGNFLKNALVASSKENKLNGITYQLLNALKTKNKQHFIDVVIRVHISENLEIPSGFIDLLTDDDVFEEFGYSFILGLRGNTWTKKESEEK